jgi:hypothetical protein
MLRVAPDASRPSPSQDLPVKMRSFGMKLYRLPRDFEILSTVAGLRASDRNITRNSPRLPRTYLCRGYNRGTRDVALC